jgi:hypothetical protein
MQESEVRNMSKWSNEDTQKETGDSASKVSEASHDARDHAASSGDLSERNANKVSDSEHGSALHDFFKGMGFFK